MKINIAICDDEKAEVDYLTLLLYKWAKSKNIFINILSFFSAENFLFHYTDDKTFDIILLDIQMSGINGVELAGKIREKNKTVQIIFITGFTDFIAEGYEVSALHYLIKPVNVEKLFKALDKAYENLNHIEKPLIITFDGEMYRIILSEIRYIEAQGHYILINTISGDYKVKKSLSDIEKNLDKRFFRCQRSFIVNLFYVRKVNRTAVILDNAVEIPLSRNLYQTVNQSIIEYFP